MKKGDILFYGKIYGQQVWILILSNNLVMHSFTKKIFRYVKIHQDCLRISVLESTWCTHLYLNECVISWV